jgi:CHAT domain-containing protein/tetratricopeptide (TPR) repeat protein
MPRYLLPLIILLLWLAPCQQAQEASDPKEIARQFASAADDNAISLEDRQEALRKLEEAARLFLSVNEKTEAARALNRAGHLQLILHHPQEAITLHNQALALIQQRPVPEIKIDGLTGLGAAYIRVEKKKKEAETALRKAISLSEKTDNTHGLAQALLTLSYSQNTYNHALALQTAQKSLALWQELNDKRGLARAYAYIGQYYMAQSLLPESIQNYEQALGLWRELNNPPEQAEALINLGYIEHRKGDWSNAIAFYIRAQSLLNEEAEPEKMGEIATGLGAAFNENGMPEYGLNQFQRALEYYQQSQNTGYAAYAISRIGVTYYLQGNYPEAITYLQQALDLVHNDTVEAECREYLGRVYISMEKYELALQQLQSALAILIQAFNPKEAARVQALMGQIAELRGQQASARKYYQLALKTFIRLSDRINQAAIYFALGRLELRNGDYDTAENYLRQSIEATEDIRRVSKISDLTAAFSATVYERYEKYIECLMLKHEKHPEQGLAVLAFKTSELARARSLAELLRATETNLVPGLDPQLARQEKSLRQLLRVKEDYKLTLLSGKKPQIKELTALDAELARLEKEYRQVTETIQALYPSYEQITRPIAWDLRQIQEQVIADDRTVLLEYSLGAEKSYVWVVTRENIASYELASQEQLNEAALKVYKLLAAPPNAGQEDELTLATLELSRLVLSPVAAELNKPRIIVVADGALHYVPFQVLQTPSDNNKLLIDRYEVINAPSASILGELQQEAARRQPAAKVLAAFGNPVFASNYTLPTAANRGELRSAIAASEPEPLHHALRDIGLNGDTFEPSVIKPLFYAKRELTSLSNLAAGGGAFVATKYDASREQLLHTDLTQYAILHFATHGILDPKRPEFSGLVLSTVKLNGQEQDGFVSLQDIYGLRAPVNLVVLSACRTAMGKNMRGEGLLSLTRGFMYAGASTVVASLWKVEDKATAELMKRFYENMLQKRMTPAAALREAQNSVRQEPRWRSPYYWAGFTLQGEYRQVIKSTTADATVLSPKIIVAGSLFALLALAAWGYRRYRVKRTAQ